MCDYSFHTVGGSCETGSDDSRVHIADYHPSAETEVGPVAVTSCTSVCPQCRQEAHVHRRMHALGLETTYRVVAAFCTTFLRWRRHWDTFWPNLIREILICFPRIWSLPTTAKKDINCVSVKLSVHMKLNVIFFDTKAATARLTEWTKEEKKEYLNKNLVMCNQFISCQFIHKVAWLILILDIIKLNIQCTTCCSIPPSSARFDLFKSSQL